MEELTLGSLQVPIQKRGKTDYTPHVTSYDYDSPINEQGGTTAKYHALK
jgi:hypothetical protein